MVSFNVLITVAVIYTMVLFGVAFYADQRAQRGPSRWLRSPWTYTLSLSVYCTAWTFYGAVGNAARSGLEYLTIYLGPTVVFLAWWWLLRKLVRIGKAERITSIADMISSRYGKSPAIAVIVTVLAIAGTTPYIALQLQSVTLSVAVFSEFPVSAGGGSDLNATAFWLSAGLALFTIFFGTRNLDANERHHGVVTAIALEAIVKLVALLAVGIFVVWGASGGLADTLRAIEASPVARWQPSPSRWTSMIFVSAAAVICLPRMFQVLVVENSDERHLRTAAWAFPAYLMAMSLFVLPIAVVGLAVMPEGSNPDLFVLTLPLELGQEGLALLAFLGGFSSATSMVIVASIALATMVSNHIVVPIWLNTRSTGASMFGDMRQVVLLSRRVSIAAVLGLGYTYYRTTGGSAALSAIGLVSFAGVAQVIPALLGGLFWRGATRRGAIAGLVVGFGLWVYTLFMPAIGVFPAAMLLEGPFGAGLLRPQALAGLTGMDPLVHSIFWSISLNTLSFVIVSLVSFPTPMERLQGAGFVNVFERGDGAVAPSGGQAETEDFLVMAQRLLGAREAQTLFQREATRQGKAGYLPDPTPDFISLLERELAGSVGGATAHAMIAQINGQASISVRDLLAVADESAQMLEYSSQLETQSRELEQTARKLREANAKLTALSVQKDAFLSQVSHELRTPMTSIRSFSEFLMEGGMDEQAQGRYAGIIHEESIRLTRLLDDLLDLSVLESGQIVLNRQSAVLRDLLDRAVSSAGLETLKPDSLKVLRSGEGEEAFLETDTDRLTQVFINLISNAQKYCVAEAPQLRIAVSKTQGSLDIDFIDNGQGIAPKDASVIFEKFARLSDQASAGSAGLGLAISREIMHRLGGTLDYLPGQGGAAFRVHLPLSVAVRTD
ncbi:ATP-binding protein [Litoreibacter janthinus]|uniref:histidine kinase n=1 Tax=Litoreibacter janthinus TaxID=670154 RepID=A0A1I6HBY2_9RHOB|nr:ATP-binding protein [Litoreibacter janthinus]SFR51787.1 His Kinase A (phospho-acceptor) domain-containing protein [Litoreibacter janthinus]